MLLFKAFCKSPSAQKPQIIIFMQRGSFQKLVEHLKKEIFKEIVMPIKLGPFFRNGNDDLRDKLDGGM